MDYEKLFSIINLLVLPGWALLIFLPRAGLTKRVVHSILYPVIFGVIYVTALGAGLFFGAAAEGGGFFSAADVSTAFSHPNGVIIGWSHYLIFDLFIGAWIGRDAARHTLPHLLVAPCLLGTFMFGPTGLLLYVLLRAVVKGKWLLGE